MTRARPAGRVYDAYLHLLDRQVVSPDGQLICKVDDLELEQAADGTLYVAAILTGPAALGPRTGGAVGRLMTDVHRRLSGGSEPGRIPYRLVSDVGSAVTVSVRPAELPIRGFEDWVRTRIIARIPGASDAPQ
jgi:hypothetical protein